MPRFNAQGTVLNVEDTPGVGVFSAVPCLVDINGPQFDVPEIDATCMDDTAKFFLPGLNDPGSISLTSFVDFQNTNVQRLFTDIDARTVRNYQLVFSDNLSSLPGAPTTATTFSFAGFIRGLPLSGGVDAVVQATLELRITGQVTYVFGA